MAPGSAAAGLDLDKPRNELGVEDTANEASGLERPGKLPRSQVTAIQNLRRRTWSIDKIHVTTGIAKSTIHKYCRNITPTGADDSEVEYRPNPEQVVQLQKLVRQGVSREELTRLFKWPMDIIVEVTQGTEPDSTASMQTPESPSRLQGEPNVQPQLPRKDAEISAPRPRLDEVNNESGNEETGYPSVPNGYATPLRLDAETQQRLLMYFGRDVLSRGYKDFLSYFDGYLMPRARQIDYYEAWLPGEDAEAKQRNFERYVKIARKQLENMKWFREMETEGDSSVNA